MWLTIEVENRSSVRCTVSLTGLASGHIGRRNTGRGDGRGQRHQHAQDNLDGLRYCRTYCRLPVFGVDD